MLISATTLPRCTTFVIWPLWLATTTQKPSHKTAPTASSPLFSPPIQTHHIAFQAGLLYSHPIQHPAHVSYASLQGQPAHPAGPRMSLQLTQLTPPILTHTHWTLAGTPPLPFDASHDPRLISLLLSPALDQTRTFYHQPILRLEATSRHKETHQRYRLGDPCQPTRCTKKQPQTVPSATNTFPTALFLSCNNPLVSTVQAMALASVRKQHLHHPHALSLRGLWNVLLLYARTFGVLYDRQQAGLKRVHTMLTIALFCHRYRM